MVRFRICVNGYGLGLRVNGKSRVRFKVIVRNMVRVRVSVKDQRLGLRVYGLGLVYMFWVRVHGKGLRVRLRERFMVIVRNILRVRDGSCF